MLMVLRFTGVEPRRYFPPPPPPPPPPPHTATTRNWVRLPLAGDERNKHSQKKTKEICVAAVDLSAASYHSISRWVAIVSCVRVHVSGSVHSKAGQLNQLHWQKSGAKLAATGAAKYSALGLSKRDCKRNRKKSSSLTTEGK